jgi:hypothetical protein
MPVRVRTDSVYADRVIIFPTNDLADLALLSSALHYWWAITYSSTLETRTNYTPSDVFETLARPETTDQTREAGTRLHQDRCEFMLGRQLGLTKTYNLVHDPGITDPAVVHLRELHVAVDEAVCAAYGWDDLPSTTGTTTPGKGCAGPSPRPPGSSCSTACCC